MLKIEVIRFEAEDVITASVETPVEKPEEVKCICASASAQFHEAESATKHKVYSEWVSTGDNNEGHWVRTYCPATEHVGCPGPIA